MGENEKNNCNPMYPKILFEKDGFFMVKEDSNCFNISFSIQKSKIYLENVIHFDLIKLIYDLNPDIFEKVEFNKIENNPNEATVYFIMKHFFEDLGMPQFYNRTHVTRITNNEYIIFEMKPILKSEQEEREPNLYELVQLPLEKMKMSCYKLTPHRFIFQCNIFFNRKREIPPYVEKLVGNIVYKIFNRVKLFIENVPV
jgi:hypothetical protein